MRESRPIWLVIQNSCVVLRNRPNPAKMDKECQANQQGRAELP